MRLLKLVACFGLVAILTGNAWGDTLSVNELKQIQDALQGFTTLTQKDELWTGHLKSNTKIRAEDVPVLKDLASEMDSLLRDSPKFAQTIRRIAEVIPDQELNKAVEKALNSQFLNEQQKNQLKKMVQQPGGIKGLALKATATVIEMTPAERAALAAKVAKIQPGATSPGDLTKAFLCGVAGNLFAGGLFALAVSGPNPVVGAVVGLSLGLAWSFDC